MYYEDNRVKDLKVAYIGGGSRGWAWGFMMDLAADAQMEGTVALYDIDHEAAEHNEIIGNKISAHPDAVSHWKYTVADTLQQALTGAVDDLGDPVHARVAEILGRQVAHAEHRGEHEYEQRHEPFPPELHGEPRQRRA